MSSDQVLLEQSVTLCGRQLALRVTTADAANPDVVAVHVRYGRGQGQVIVRADEEESSEVCISSTRRRGSASAVSQTLDSAGGPTVEHKETDERSGNDKEETEPLDVSTRGQDVTAGTEEVSSPAGEERQSTAPLAASGGHQLTINAATGRDHATAGTPTRGDQTISAAAGRDDATAGTPTKGEGGAEQLTVAGDEAVDHPAQAAASDSSRPCEDAGDASSARRTELHIRKDDLPTVLDDSALEKLLQKMPELRRLIVDWRPDGKKNDVDIVSKHCPNLVELDLTRFRLDSWSLKQLCIACPKLEVVKLPRKSDDACVEVLLRNLPHLRSLDLSYSKVRGQFLRTCHEFMAKPYLTDRSGVKLDSVADVHRSAESIPQIPPWEKIKKLDLSFTDMRSANIIQVINCFPRLERLSLAHTKLSETPEPAGVSQASCQPAALTQLKEPSQLRHPDQCQVPLLLRELNVCFATGLATSDLVAILSRSTKLERLLATELDGMDLTNCLTQLSRCSELRDLNISRSGFLKQIPRRHSEMVGSERAYVNMHMPGVFGTVMVDKERRKCEFISRQIQSSVLTSLLSGCQKLERLILAGCHITESASLRQLAQCQSLRKLNLSRVTTVKAEDLARDERECQSVDAADLAQGLSGCPLLKRLSVEGLNAPLEQLVPPSGLPELTYLDASRSGLANNSLRRLPGLFPKLHTLIMYGCVSVSEDGIMSYLPRLQHLRFLDIRYVPGATGAAVEKLKKCQQTKLHLDGRKLAQEITPAGLVKPVVRD